MALIEEVSGGTPLRQGDILKGIALYATADDAEDAVPVDTEYVLVLSRHCNAVRKVDIAVAIITESTPEVLNELSSLSLDETRRRLSALRDGDGTPDRFYLGPLPGRGLRRSFARLDLLHTIRLPLGEVARQLWIDQRRVGTLSDEHRRHLHTSLMLAFAREGFDDFAWWPDGDLQLMIAAGTRALTEAQRKRAEIHPTLQAAAPITNEKGKESKFQGLTKQSQTASAEIALRQADLDPYLAEWRRRHGDRDPLD